LILLKYPQNHAPSKYPKKKCLLISYICIFPPKILKDV
jgi:hypothetical protein